MFRIQVLCQIYVVKIFFSYACIFIFLIVPDKEQKLLITIKFNFSIFIFYAICVHNKSMPIQGCKDFLGCFFKNIIVLAFIFRYMNHFKLLHEKDVKKIVMFIFFFLN